MKKHYQLPRRQIGYLRFILESYDGLAFVRTLDPHQALVEIAYPESRREDAESLLAALGGECAMTVFVAPKAVEFPSL